MMYGWCRFLRYGSKIRNIFPFFNDSRILHLICARFVRSLTLLFPLHALQPWCGHCKKLAPVFDQVANKVTNDLVHLGKVDATVHRKVAKMQEISRYPTIKYYKHGHWGKYEGLRSVDDLLEFTERLAAPAARKIASIDELRDYPVSFLLQIPNMRSERNKYVMDTFEDAALKLHGRKVDLFKIDNEDGDDNMPAVLNRMYGDKITKSLILRENVSSEEIDEFIISNNRPLVSRLDNSNFKALGDLGLVMIIAVVDYNQKEESKALIDKVTTTANQLTANVQDKIVFGHVDGVKWRKFMSLYDAKPNTILILHLIDDAHITLSGKEASLDNLNEIAHRIHDDTLLLNKAVPRGFFAKTWRKLVDYFPASLLCFVPIVMIIMSFTVSTRADKEKKL